MQVRGYLEEQDDVPFQTLNVMLADVTYGGRVTDAKDQRTNSAVVSKYFNPSILDDDYKFDPNGIYYAPAAGVENTLQETRDYIKTLPVDEVPETFGMHPNADITYQQQLTKKMLDTVITVGGSGGGGGSKDTGAADAAIEVAKDMESKLPPAFDARKGHPETFKKIQSGSVNSLGVFLSQEMMRFNKLIAVMKKTLFDLQRAAKGLIVMSGPLEDMFTRFQFQRVPKQWEDAGYPCLKPLATWIPDHFARIDHLTDWLMNGPPPVFWLSGYFFPQGFMTGVKQTYSRKYHKAVDLLTVGCQPMPFMHEDITKPPEDGSYIWGMYMQGARFDAKSLKMAESRPHELFDPVCAILLKPEESKDYNPQNCYLCPMYKTSIRAGTLSTTGHSTNFVVALHLPSDQPEDHWVRRGTAMLLMLDT
jgi:dynein heavy chain